ncbi:MAG: ion channel [Candidatus Caldarchaeum sp.]|nr:ion channel [Candidatus Caldarchaeum sp.]
MAGREIAASVLTVFSIVLILVEYLVPLSFEAFVGVVVVDGLVVLFLSVDLLLRASESGRVGNYLLRHWYEVVALLPLAFFYLLETQTFVGAIIRGFRLSRVLRLLLVVARTRKSIVYLFELIRVSRLGYLFAVSAAIVFIGTVSAFFLEVGVADSKIRDLGDAFWWALATVTTVGYGDVVPVTPAGRIIGSVLMITGIAIIGVFISSLGSALLSLPRATSSPLEELKNYVKNKIDNIETLSKDELGELIELIRTLHEVNGRAKGV